MTIKMKTKTIQNAAEERIIHEFFLQISIKAVRCRPIYKIQTEMTAPLNQDI